MYQMVDIVTLKFDSLFRRIFNAVKNEFIIIGNGKQVFGVGFMQDKIQLDMATSYLNFFNYLISKANEFVIAFVHMILAFNEDNANEIGIDSIVNLFFSSF